MTDLISLQETSRRLLKLARDGSLWRFQCYYDSPKSRINRIGQKSWSQALAQSLVGHQQHSNADTRMSNKARATDEWDLSDPSESIDWYSEYVARHAQLSASWLGPEDSGYEDIRGAALYEDGRGKKLVGVLEGGSISVWDVVAQGGGPSRHVRIDSRSMKSSPGILFDNTAVKGCQVQSDKKRALPFSGVADCVSVDATRERAYVAVGDLLNEIDLNSLRIVSQAKYPWPITALSQVQNPHQPLTVGTSFSLHILDLRSPSTESPGSSSGGANLTDSIAYFNNDISVNIDPARGHQPNPHGGFGFGPGLHSHISTSTSPLPNRRMLSSYAALEPGPLSILHQNPHSIMVAGRFPSILNYDRRFFPRLEYVIHSSARLSALTYLPFSPRSITNTESSALGTLIAGGEYNGCGSLELYSVPQDTSISSGQASDDAAAPEISSYKNRQSISPSKLLSVTTQGTRIVFSDADGGLKWVERDGRSIVRRWNINSYELYRDVFPKSRMNNGGRGRRYVEAGLQGEGVVRKILPTGMGESDDLLVWTGERVGLVQFGRSQEEWFDAADSHLPKSSSGSENGSVVQRYDDLVGPARVDGPGEEGDGDDDIEARAQEYERQMRRALERQADELNWMGRFGFRGT